MDTLLVISLLIYISMVFFTRHRTVIAAVGSGILLFFGSLSNSFSANSAFQKFPTGIVIFIIVLTIYIRVFEINGFFDDIGKVFAGVTKGRRVLFVALSPFALFFTSLFFNNLSMILLLTFLLLKMSVKYKLPAVPLLVSSLIGSNIGGYPLPWADTPAMILTLYSGYILTDFLEQLFLPCLIYAILLSVYTVLWFRYEDEKMQEAGDKLPGSGLKPPPGENHSLPSGLIYTHDDSQAIHHRPVPPHLHKTSSVQNRLQPSQHDNGQSPSSGKSVLKSSREQDWRGKNIPLLLFLLMILSTGIAPFFNISVAYVSLFFGALLLLVIRDNPEDIITSLPIVDALAFISALFLIAATLEYSGVLKSFVDYLLVFAGNNSFLIVLCILVLAFIITTFLSAGPAAATLLPICQQLSSMAGDKIIYTALALGILAGSSMLPWSSTGGLVLLSEAKRFLKKNEGMQKEKGQVHTIFDLKRYISFSIPFSLVLLILSGLFLSFYIIAF